MESTSISSRSTRDRTAIASGHRHPLVASYDAVMSQPNVAAVVGVGPGLGASVAARFAREGFVVALLARSAEKLGPIQAAIPRSLAVSVDATDAPSMTAGFDRVQRELGTPDVLVYNAGAFVVGGVLELEPETFEQSWKANCLGGFLAARAVVPAMLERGRGTVIFSGATASLRGAARFAGLAVGKFGLRALAQSMARELGPQGIHVAHVIIDGMIDTVRMRAMVGDRPKETMLDPAAIAETYWQLHAQDRTAWTHELDLRPAVEKF
jgi:NAD(P)-dependent dehydrogenase (short-subunit alcohol dehydrogenase family)